MRFLTFVSIPLLIVCGMVIRNPGPEAPQFTKDLYQAWFAEGDNARAKIREAQELDAGYRSVGMYRIYDPGPTVCRSKSNQITMRFDTMDPRTKVSFVLDDDPGVHLTIWDIDRQKMVEVGPSVTINCNREINM